MLILVQAGASSVLCAVDFEVIGTGVSDMARRARTRNDLMFKPLDLQGSARSEICSR